MLNINCNYNSPVRGILFIAGIWLCCGLLWILPNHGGSGLALPQNLLAWCAMALLVLWCTLTERRVKFVFPSGTRPIVTGAILWSLPLLWSPSSAWQWNAATKVMALWGLLIVWLELLKTPISSAARRYWLLILVMSAFLQVIYSVCQLADRAALPGGRPYGIFQQVNVLASFVATGMVCALWLNATARQKWVTRFCSLSLIMLPAMLVLLQSRAGYLGAISGCLIVLLVGYKKHRSRRRSSLLLILAGVSLGLMVLHVGPLLFPGFAPGLVDKGDSDSQRWYILQLTWQLIQNHPVIGNGYGSFEALLAQLAQQTSRGLESKTILYPHNEFFYTWMEGGLVAVAGVILMIGGILKRLWSRGGRRWAGLAILLPLALHMNLEYPLYQSVTHGLLLILLLFICGPTARPVKNTVPRGMLIKRAVRCIAAISVVIFMVTGVVSEVQMTTIEQQGLYPLATDESATVAAVINPWSQYDRLDFDRHVALLLRFNLIRDPDLLTRFQAWAEQYRQVHNSPDVYHSLMMIYRAQKSDKAKEICIQASTLWPDDTRFNCK
ncbi:O-antigen ligase C-terminal domain-containing protein [Citrobacter sp. ku-bf4]|uniref:PglL family O-oligosaccharyltransferase n=1 Tax=Citrobacter TaxID=544 RepID=UPI0019826183|nr:MULTISPECIES: O-antigen ligase family protein [Citrobacter]MBN6045341.1 O-antigen ligase C-terminal domain-containing protein [Citrobacter sp. ku-bf4]MBS0826717.1 O-antigen ligase C-terminal domain-containing protein [Citrobacter amalonaticus]